MTKVVSIDGPPVIGDRIVDQAFVLIDAETSDNIKRGVDADHPIQPWLAELSLLFVVQERGQWQAIDGYHAFVRPNAFWKMAPEATRINGITNELLHTEGVPVTDVLDRWEQALQGGFIPCAFNFGFDGKVMRGAMRRSGRRDYRQTPYVDTMLDAHAHTKLRNSKGGGKFPNLIEACQFFGVPTRVNPGLSHKAIRDNDMQRDLLMAMIKRGHPPRVRTLGNVADFEPATASRITPVTNYKPANPRSLADLPDHRKPTKRG